jgi:thioredoxin
MTIQTCAQCSAKNRVDELTATEKQPVCGKCGAPLPAVRATATGKPQTVTDESFARDVVEASLAQPVLVDAWAEWCGPCRMIAPVLDELAAEANGKYRIAKLNVDENPRTAAQFKIRSIPTLLIFKNGQLVDLIMGAQPKPAIAARLAAQQ